MVVIALLLAQDIAAPATAPTAAQVLARYRQMTGIGPMHRATCPKDNGKEIVVCGRSSDAERLPLPEERFGPGEVVVYRSEAPSATNAFRGRPQEPSKLGETIVKTYKGIKSLITGEDPNF